MKFEKRGWFFVGPALGLAIAWHIYSLPTKYNPVHYFLVITLPIALGIVLLASFFRDPHRTPETRYIEGRSVLSPADGNICAIEMEGDSVAIYVEMHYYNAHVTRSHLAGKVIKIWRMKGKHHLVYFVKKSKTAKTKAIAKNARTIIELEDQMGQKYHYYMICGAFFRRAIPYVKEGDWVKEGQKMGTILFGSTVKITIPGSKYKLLHSVGDRVQSGHTVICEKQEE